MHRQGPPSTHDSASRTDVREYDLHPPVSSLPPPAFNGFGLPPATMALPSSCGNGFQHMQHRQHSQPSPSPAQIRNPCLASPGCMYSASSHTGSDFERGTGRCARTPVEAPFYQQPVVDSSSQLNGSQAFPPRHGSCGYAAPSLQAHAYMDQFSAHASPTPPPLQSGHESASAGSYTYRGRYGGPFECVAAPGINSSGSVFDSPVPPFPPFTPAASFSACPSRQSATHTNVSGSVTDSPWRAGVCSNVSGSVTDSPWRAGHQVSRQHGSQTPSVMSASMSTSSRTSSAAGSALSAAPFMDVSKLVAVCSYQASADARQSILNEFQQRNLPVANLHESPAHLENRLCRLSTVGDLLLPNGESMGLFAMKKTRTRDANAKRGYLACFTCCWNKHSRPGIETTSCKFVVNYEWTNGGWCPFSSKFGHDHELPARTPTALPNALVSSSQMRVIPSAFDEIGELMAAAGLTAKFIKPVLAEKARREGITVTWEYEDVYNAYIRNNSNHLDASGLMDMLAKRERKKQLRHFIHTDDQNHISRTFVEMDGAREVWGTHRTRYKLGNVLILDPTFGTNRYGLKLSFFITVDSEGVSRILAYVLHNEESHDDIFWALKCFDKVFKTRPNAIFTDSGAGLAKAILTFTDIDMPWCGTVHFLCIYHVYKNFYSHIRPLFNGNEEKWKVVHQLFWSLGKKSHHSPEELKDIVSNLFLEMTKHGRGNSKSTALKWFSDTLLCKKSKWAAAYTWNVFTAGVHATQRVESMFGVVKRILPPNSTLMHLQTKLDTHVDSQLFRDALSVERRALKNKAVAEALPQVLVSMRRYVSEYAFELILAQYFQFVTYDVTVQTSDDGRIKYNVTRQHPLPLPELCEEDDEGKAKVKLSLTDLGLADVFATHTVSRWDCTCKYMKAYGVPCRHWWAAKMKHDACHDTEFDTRYDEEDFNLWNHVNFRWLVKFGEDIYAETDDVEQNEDDENDVDSEEDDDDTGVYVNPVSESDESDEDEGGDDDFEPTTCYNSFKQTCDSAWVQPVTPNLKTFYRLFKDCEFEGHTVLVKYGNCNQGGWHAGQIQMSHEVDAGLQQCYIYYVHSDRSRPQTTLAMDKMVKLSSFNKQQKLPYMSWSLAAEKSLGSDLSETPSNPPSKKRGRPQTKRRKPIAGPMS